MLADAQPIAQTSNERPKRPPLVGRPFPKGKSANPGGVPKDGKRGKRLLAMCERRAREILKRVDAPAASVMAAIAFLERQAERRSAPPSEQARTAADVLREIHQSAVDQVGDKPTDAQGVTVIGPRK
jgi:hypothetical protein